MAFFETGTAKLHYEIVEGILPHDTFFIHGNLASLRWWHPSEQIWRKQASGPLPGAMIRVDFLGCGQSSEPRSQNDVDMQAFARDFVSLLKSLRRPGSTNLVGHSTGGLIAALMLAQAPELFHRAILLDSVGPRGVTFDESMTAAFEKMKSDRGLVAAVIGATIRGQDPDSRFFREFIVEDACRSIQNTGDKVLRALSGLDLRSRLGQIPHPVLVLHGEHDLLLPVSDSHEMAALLKNAQFSIIPGQGHCANIENPELFVDMSSRFLFAN